ncbi:Cullin protein neddylation domain-containing protein [Pelagophyceae sp. CCMP2097]|nr:Cullin protein neddylation domain-containing protein [Pelagophyceae sp. CCMP2097]
MLRRRLFETWVDVEVQASRTFNIDATLVRIMKARKRLAHQELVGEVIHQIQHFKPEPFEAARLVRQRIEGLIERDNLERDDDDAKVHTHLP